MWVQVETFIWPCIVLNFNISFNICARLRFNVIWFVKCMKTEIISVQHNSFIDLSFSIKLTQGLLKLFVLNLVVTHLLNFFIISKQISDWHHFCK